ncbi:MAG: hypothetical protein HWE20_04600 [Gammaproteobacteria bacterium]|nr:hypothetical protein [Gammaproteobacteria bacterium]
MELPTFTRLANACAALGVVPDIAHVDRELANACFEPTEQQIFASDDSFYLILRDGHIRRVWLFSAGANVERLGLGSVEDALMSGGFDRAELIDQLPSVMAYADGPMDARYGFFASTRRLGRYGFRYYRDSQLLLEIDEQTLREPHSMLSERELQNRDHELQQIAQVYGRLSGFNCQRSGCGKSLASVSLRRFFKCVIRDNQFRYGGWSLIEGRCPDCWSKEADASYLRSAEAFEYRRLAQD